MFDIRNSLLIGISDIAESWEDVDELEWYGLDPFATTSSDCGLSTVEVEDVNIALPIDILTLLRQNIDHLQHSIRLVSICFRMLLLILTQAGE